MDRGLPRRGTLGRSLGVAVLGSVGTAAYRSSIESSLPDNLPADAAAAASDSIDGAPTYADELPGALGQQLWRIVSSLVTNHAARQHVSPITYLMSGKSGNVAADAGEPSPLETFSFLSVRAPDLYRCGIRQPGVCADSTSMLQYGPKLVA